MRKKYSPSYTNDEMQKIISHLEISPIKTIKQSVNIFDYSITPLDLSLVDKGKNELKLDLVPHFQKKKNENMLPITAKRAHTRQISFIESSSQHIKNETISNMDYNLHLKKNISAMKIEKLEDTIINKKTLQQKKLSELISKNKNLELIVNFIINKIGKEKFSFLIECIEQSDNPFEFIQNSEIAYKICGKDYVGIVSMLKKIIITAYSSK